MEVTFTGARPIYGTKGAAGADLSAQQDYIIPPGEQVAIDTGTCIQLPEFLCGMLMPRSSLCNKNGLRLVNSVGLLDEDYTGTLKFVYFNHGTEPVYISECERIGQICIMPYIKAQFQRVECLDETERGSGSFGSTGK